MKLKSILLSLGLVAAPFSASAQQAEDTFKANPKLSTALKHVDTDGEALSVSNQKDFLEDIAKYYDTMLKPFFQMNENSQFMDFGKLLTISGFNQITATAGSSKKYGNHYINKYFIQTSQTSKGLWSLWGKEEQATVAQTIAPVGTNILLETQVNTSQLYNIIIEAMKIVNRDEVEFNIRNFSQKIPPTDMTVREMLEKIDTRVSIVATVDLKKSLNDMKTPPSFKVSARIDNLAKLMWPVIQPELSKMGKIESKGSLHSFDFPELDTEIGPLQLSILFNLESNHIWITTNKNHLADCRDSQAPKLATAEHYKAAMNKLPKTGCAQFYLAKDLGADILKVSVKSLDFGGGNEPIPSIQKLIKQIIPHVSNSNGIAWIVQKDKDGILFVSNTPFRIRGVMMQYVTFISTMASIATPLVIQKRKEADQVKNMMIMRQLKLSIVEYEIAKGRKPKSLDDLIKHDPAIKGLSMMKAQGGQKPVVYVFKEQPKDKDIMMHSPSPILGQYVVMLHDGTILKLYDDELEEMLGE